MHVSSCFVEICSVSAAMLRRWPFLIPFLFMSAGMVLSVATGYFCDVVSVAVAFICMVLTGFLRYGMPFSVSTALFFFFWGLFSLSPWLAPEPSPHSVERYASASPVVIEGVIADRPSVASEGGRLTVQVERVLRNDQIEAVSGLLQLYVREGDIPLTRGDRIRFASRITVPHRLGLPGEFDYHRYLALQGISATSYVASPGEIVLMRAAAVDSVQRTIDRQARLLGDSIRRSIPDERVSSILTALLLGDRRIVPADLADAYTRAGVTHILSISGFHVGIIAAFITVLVIWGLTRFEYPALRWEVRKIAILIAVPAMVAYLFLTGNAPSTARSVIMLTVFALALLAERERDPINTLLLAAFLLVGAHPPTLFDVSFQLSFISLWGILVAIPPVTRMTESISSPVLRGLLRFAAVSAAVTCVTLVPALFIFKVASFNGILTNFLIIPLLGYGAVLAGFTVLPLVVLLPAYASLLLWPAAVLVAIANRIIMWCTSLPVITFHGITGTDMFFFLLFMTVVTFLKGRMHRVVSGVLILLSGCALHLYAAAAGDGRLHITMLSVGQAEAVVVRLPDSSTLLIDGGGYLHDTDLDFGQRVLAPALGALHVGRIDRMVATHSHPDHSGGLPYVMKNFAVGEFWSGTDISDAVRKELDTGEVPQRTLVFGDVIKLPGQVSVTVLSPAVSGRTAPGNDDTSVNEQSLVLRLSYGAFSILFCADAGFEAERRMLDGTNELRSTVLKVGHHGSRYSTSEAFLARVHPELALISVGAGNRFGLPSARTVKLLQAHNVPLYRTDRDGTIELVSDGVGWSVATPYRPD